MKLYILCGYNIFEAGDEPELNHYFYNKPALDELKECFYDDVDENGLTSLLNGGYIIIKDYKYKLYVINLDNNRLLENINK